MKVRTLVFAWTQSRSCLVGSYGFQPMQVHCNFHYSRQEVRFHNNSDKRGVAIRSISALGMGNIGQNKNGEKRKPSQAENADDIDGEYGKGLLVLATVPMAWGTFEPAVRLVYKYEPSMPPLVFSFAYYLVATLVLSTVGKIYESTLSSSEFLPAEPSDPPKAENTASNDVVEEEIDFGNSSLSSSSSSPHVTTVGTETFGLLSGLPLSIAGGIELGTYLFVGNVFQVIGLKTVPSDRAAFLLQLTTIFVPLLKSFNSSASIPLPTWIACLVALLGVGLIGLDDGSGSGYSNGIGNLFDHRIPAFSMEDGYIILAAVFYTFHCVRLETYARSTSSAIGLATAKATTEMLWSGIVIAGCIVIAQVMAHGHDGDNASFGGVLYTARVSGEKMVAYGKDNALEVSSFWEFVSGGWPMIGLATFWVGTVTVAYTIYAQSFGQSRAPAVTANLIYSSQPIFTSLVAYFLLGESLGENGYIGGTLIGTAVLLVIAAEAEPESTTDHSETMTIGGD